MPKLVAMLRVKDGMLYVERWLRTMERLADDIVVVDNGSTDGTMDVLRNHPKVVSIDRTEGFHEGRDKVLAYQRARERRADWIIWLDVDEYFEERLDRAMLDVWMSSTGITRYFFRRFHMYRSEHRYLASPYSLWGICLPERVMWKDQPSGHFLNVKMHNGLIRGIQGRSRITPIRIRHFACLYPEHMREKTARYIQLDPGRTDMYLRHRDQVVNEAREQYSWPWHEYAERPVRVAAVNGLLNGLFLVRWTGLKAAALGRRLWRRDATGFASPVDPSATT